MQTLFTVQSSGCIYQIEKPPWTWLFTHFVVSHEKKTKLSLLLAFCYTEGEWSKNFLWEQVFQVGRQLLP